MVGLFVARRRLKVASCGEYDVPAVAVHVCASQKLARHLPDVSTNIVQRDLDIMEDSHSDGYTRPVPLQAE